MSMYSTASSDNVLNLSGLTVQFCSESVKIMNCMGNRAETGAKMITIELRKALLQYIEEHYIPPSLSQNPCVEGDVCKAGNNETELVPRSLREIMDDVGQSFHELLFSKIDESGLTDVEIYKKANIDRKLFSKIRSNPAYHPRKQTVLALAIALELQIDDAVALLASAEYAFSPGNKGDLIVKYFIEHGVYDIITINFALSEYEQSLLE